MSPGNPDVAGPLLRAVEACCAPWLAERAEDLVRSALAPSGSVPGDAPRSAREGYVAVVREIRRLRAERRAERGTPPPGDRLEAALLSALSQIQADRRRAVTLFLLGSEVADVARRLGSRNAVADDLVAGGLTELRHALLGDDDR